MTTFLDVDGLVCDLTGELCRERGRDPATWPAGVYDLSTVLGVPADELWRDRSEAWWAGLPTLPWASALVAEVERLSFGRWAFLTAPVADPRSAAGKLRWLRARFPTARVFVGAHKELLASPGCGHVLVDDHDANVEAFQVAGGLAITWPARWNARHAEASDPWPIVRDELRRLLV